MKRVASVAGLALFGLVNVANDDSPGGWSQFDALVAKAQDRDKIAPVQEVQRANPVYQFNAGQQRSTSLFPANPAERATN
jgi:hypothetical protein